MVVTATHTVLLHPRPPRRRKKRHHHATAVLQAILLLPAALLAAQTISPLVVPSPVRSPLRGLWPAPRGSRTPDTLASPTPVPTTFAQFRALGALPEQIPALMEQELEGFRLLERNKYQDNLMAQSSNVWALNQNVGYHSENIAAARPPGYHHNDGGDAMQDCQGDHNDGI